MSLYKKTKQFVKESFEKTGDNHSFKHFVRTVHWIKELKPDADEAMLIAAIAHDIEHAFADQDKRNKTFKNSGFKNDDFLTQHQTEGAQIIADFLKRQNADQKLIARVKMLIEKHEVGGNKDQNILKDADSISYFENNVGHFVNTMAKRIGKDKVKDKFDWMYNRISSNKAKQIALEWYNDAIAKLQNQ